MSVSVPCTIFSKFSLLPILTQGFIAAIAPFNFTAIGGQLWSTPVLMGNCAVYKPCDTAISAGYVLYQLFQEAGLPAGTWNCSELGECVNTLLILICITDINL